MATMGVHWTSGQGSSGLGEALSKAAKAYFGDPDFEISLAKARSALETDQYQRGLIRASEDWTRSRQSLTDAEISARQRGEEDIKSTLQRYLNRGQQPVVDGSEAPVPVDMNVLPPEAPIPTARADAVGGDWPAPVQVGETPIPTPTPAPLQGADQLPAPVEVPAGQEPDFNISTYPVRSEMLPETAPIPQPRPMDDAGPVPVDEAMMRLRPPDELAPQGQALPDMNALAQATRPDQNLHGVPPELQPVPVQPLDQMGPPVPAPFAGGTTTQVPGRELTELRDFQGPTVPVEAQPAGPPSATGAILPPPMRGEAGPQAMPGSPVMADVQGPLVPSPEAPAGPPTATGAILPPNMQGDTQQLMPGETRPQADGTIAVGTPKGTMNYTPEQLDGIAALIAFSADPGGQTGKFSGLLDIMNRGPSIENTTLYSGNAPGRDTVLGTDEAIRFEQEKAKLAPPDYKKNVISEGGVDRQLYMENGEIKEKPVPGGQPADAMGGTSDTQTFLRSVRDTALLMNQPNVPITPDQAMNYELAYNSLQKPSYDWQDVPASPEYPNGGKARVPIPPVDLSNYPPPAAVRARAGLPSAAPAPAAPAPAVQAPTVAAPAVAAPAGAEQPVPPAGAGQPVPPAVAAPAIAAPAQPAPSPPVIPGNKPLDPTDPTSGPAVGTQPDGQILGTSGKMIILPKSPKERNEFQARAWLWLNEAAHANMMMKKMKTPGWFQDWLLDPQREDPSVWNAWLKAKGGKNETRQFMSSAQGFVNSEGRINSGATIRNPEDVAFGYRFIPKDGDNETTVMLKGDNRKVALDSIYDALDVSGMLTPSMHAQLKAYGYDRSAPLPSQQAGQPNVIDYNPSQHGGGGGG